MRHCLTADMAWNLVPRERASEVCMKCSLLPLWRPWRSTCLWIGGTGTVHAAATDHQLHDPRRLVRSRQCARERAGHGVRGQVPVHLECRRLAQRGRVRSRLPRDRRVHVRRALHGPGSPGPIDIYLDGQKVHRGFAGITGSWQTSSARWEVQCTMPVTQGRHTAQVVLPRPMHVPRVCACDSSRRCPFRRTGDWSGRWPSASAPAQRRLPAQPHFVPAIPGLGTEPVSVEQVEFAVASTDSEFGPAANNELLADPERRSAGSGSAAGARDGPHARRCRDGRWMSPCRQHASGR